MLGYIFFSFINFCGQTHYISKTYWHFFTTKTKTFISL